MKLKYTKILKGVITIETGIHIGGAKSALDIGGLDSPVIKTPFNVPYIPGSSLKGKIRSLLASEMSDSESAEEDVPLIKKLFGYQGNRNGEHPQISRLIFRDANLDEEHFRTTFTQKNAILDTSYTVAKYENTIDRLGGTTVSGGLRQIERVPAGAKFNFEIVLNVFEGDEETQFLSTIEDGIKLLENNYLGGSGTRGYGKVSLSYTII